MRAVALLVFAFPSLVYAQAATGGSAAAGIKRGKYLVHDIAVCSTCHTPRGADGSPDEQRPLAGGPVPYEPARPIEGWATVAPRLAGLPPGTDEQFIKLMMTGISRTGRPPRPPMPQFRMTRSDAEAVLAYLKSVRTE